MEALGSTPAYLSLLLAQLSLSQLWAQGTPSVDILRVASSHPGGSVRTTETGKCIKLWLLLSPEALVQHLPADHFPRDLFVLFMWSGVAILCLLGRPWCLRKRMTSHRAKAEVPLYGLALHHLPWVPSLCVMAAGLAGTWDPTLRVQPHGLRCVERQATLSARSPVSCMHHGIY